MNRGKFDEWRRSLGTLPEIVASTGEPARSSSKRYGRTMVCALPPITTSKPSLTSYRMTTRGARSFTL